MYLGLSGRLIEKGAGAYAMPTPEFIAYAAEVGFRAVELRSGQVSETTSDAELGAIKQALDDTGVLCHYINCRVPQTEETRPVLRRHVEIAALLGCDLIQVGTDCIPWMQEMCDFAAGFGVRLFAQFHTGGVMETVGGGVFVGRNVARANFGIGYEPANLMAAREEYGVATLKAMGDLFMMVKVQCLKHTDDPNAADVWQFKGQRLVRCLPDDPAGVDFPKVFAALKEVGFDGAVTIMDAMATFMDNDQYIRQYYAYLSTLL
jgi:sugar phosphate isomerase/epimerase